MKLAWKKTSGNKRSHTIIPSYPNLPFDSQTEQEHEKSPKENEDNENSNKTLGSVAPDQNQIDSDQQKLAETFQSQGNQLAEDGKYQEALGKWEAALTLMPENAVLHEQKAQLLLEIGDAWGALKAATRATELEPSWAEAWMTLGRAQLNFGEPDSSLKSFDKALAIKPDLEEARADRIMASHLMKRRKQLHSSGSMSVTESRYRVGDKAEMS